MIWPVPEVVVRARRWGAVALALVAAGWGGAGYLSTKPIDFHDYRVAAVHSAQSAYNAVTTAERTVRADLAGKLPGPYVTSMLADGRKALSGAAKEFAGKAPPDARTRAMRDALGPLLLQADAVLGDAESAVAGDDDAALHAAVDALGPVADDLAGFIEAHR